MQKTCWPTRTFSESARGTGFTPAGSLATLSSAMSSERERVTITAFWTSPFWNSTEISSAVSTTWAAVAMKPSACRTTPAPVL
jgi:hypothetical protein